MKLTGMLVLTVEPGTVVGQNDDGKDMVVTDESAVIEGCKMWVTPKIFAALKAKCDIEEGRE